MPYYTFLPFYFFEYLMLRANMGKARIGGRDVNVPCNPLKFPLARGSEGFLGATTFGFDFSL